jgi:mono/diheme cytochrome c family protein
MKGGLVFALLALTACSEQPTTKFAFADVAVRLPQDATMFPVREGSEAMNANCAACHSTSMILLQPALTTDQWKGEVKKMREVYKAPVDPAAEPAILAYLEATSAELASPKVAPAR